MLGPSGYIVPNEHKAYQLAWQINYQNMSMILGNDKKKRRGNKSKIKAGRIKL